MNPAEPPPPGREPWPALRAEPKPRRLTPLRLLLGFVRWVGRGAGRLSRSTVAYFREQDPTFWAAFTPALLVSALLFVRSPFSNYIFDEQEALLANPYVNDASIPWSHAFRRDFWGLLPTRTIGSYRPIPNLIWRALWHINEAPWLHHWVNVLGHAVNAALVAGFAFHLTRRRGISWIAGLAFVSSAVLTEAITGVVGIADVLGGMGVLLALTALRLPLYAMPLGVFLATIFSLFSKESGLTALPLVSWTALLVAPVFHPHRPWRVPRALLALIASVGALVAYTYFRRHYFPITLPEDFDKALPHSEPLVKRVFHEFQRWFQQPRLPHDPINNPLVEAPPKLRIAGALRVYFRGLGQVFLPLRLSGDYSFPAEPVPARAVFVESILGGVLLLAPPVVGVGVWIRGLFAERGARRGVPAHYGAAHARLRQHWTERLGERLVLAVAPAADVAADPMVAGYRAPAVALSDTPPAKAKPLRLRLKPWAAQVVDPVREALASRLGILTLFAIGLVWAPVAYFPHSNIPLLLPTVRAERFWYLPVIGSSLVIAGAGAWLSGRLSGSHRKWLLVVAGLFFGLQAIAARDHALDYTDDLVFWRATRRAVPDSAKAQLNYSVMVGARGRLEERLAVNKRAMELAPQWPMAHVYYADTLCRLKRSREAWPEYVKGFELGPNDINLIALGLQCLWDEGAIEGHRDELEKLAEKHPGSWLAYLANDIIYNGAKHQGVDPKYRPRAYNAGPKSD